jgi:hypothetical protein
MTLITLKVSPDRLDRIDAEANRLGITRTALLLRPWADMAITTERPAHAETCKCLICKPPKS